MSQESRQPSPIQDAEGGHVSWDKWHLLEIELQDRFLKELEENGGPPPKCEDAGWQQGKL
ncbi:GL16039 [Drosophila persimilis]|uniref:GL16039 n=1 Tax=Drosophila persimilis TaxID=7234 RepID=B4HDL5_DROPE|nr:GL16039 [Drosophila persimilis]